MAWPLILSTEDSDPLFQIPSSVGSVKVIVTALPIMTLSTQSCSPLRTLVLIVSILSSTSPRYQFISQGPFLNYLWSAQWRISEG